MTALWKAQAPAAMTAPRTNQGERREGTTMMTQHRSRRRYHHHTKANTQHLSRRMHARAHTGRGTRGGRGGDATQNTQESTRGLRRGTGATRARKVPGNFNNIHGVCGARAQRGRGGPVDSQHTASHGRVCVGGEGVLGRVAPPTDIPSTAVLLSRGEGRGGEG
jgi:hypothetical protein